MIKKISSKLSIGKSLILLLPLSINFLYFYSIGRNRYLVTSDIVIRKASDKVQTDLTIGSLLGSGNKSSKEDSLYMKTFLRSPQVLEIAENKINFSNAYKKKFPDFFAGIPVKSKKNDIYDFFIKQINVNYLESSGILKIKTNAFDPITAFKLNNLLINQAEIFANELNQSIFKKQLYFVNNQVKLKAKEVELASKKLLEFQRNNSILDPKSEAKLSSNFISALETELVKLRVELANLKRKFISDKEPEIVDITNQILELSEQINKERKILVSPDGKNLNSKILIASDLEYRLKFALDLYKNALSTSEATKNDSLQQQRFISIISEPQVPDKRSFNWRHKGFFSFSLILFLLFGLKNFLRLIANNRRN